MPPVINFLYLSRNFNRIGYHVLSHLLKKTAYLPQAVILPFTAKENPLDDPSTADRERTRYFRESRQFGCRPVRFMESIKMLSEQHHVPVMRLRTIKDPSALHEIQALRPDLIVLGGGWPELIPEQILTVPELGVINTHPSLLPGFRGTDVHRWQVYHGVRRSGSTIHYVDESFDTGDIIGQSPVDIEPGDTPQDLSEKAGIAAGPLMENVLDRIAAAAPHRTFAGKQRERNDPSRYFSRWRWEDRDFLRIDWSKPSLEIHRFVLACTQESYRYNGPFFYVHGREYMLRMTSLEAHDGSGVPGQIVRSDDRGMVVRCGEGDVALNMVQVQPCSMRNWNTHTHRARAFHPRLLIDEGVVHIHDRLE